MQHAGLLVTPVKAVKRVVRILSPSHVLRALDRARQNAAVCPAPKSAGAGTLRNVAQVKPRAMKRTLLVFAQAPECSADSSAVQKGQRAPTPSQARAAPQSARITKTAIRVRSVTTVSAYRGATPTMTATTTRSAAAIPGSASQVSAAPTRSAPTQR